ncbi:MAG: hypothetical protein J6K32_01040 [Clostridia bacterium]|nr:hypothetical protein [Clostridia bacterium]
MIITEGLRYADEKQPVTAAAALLCRVEYAASALFVFDHEQACLGVCLFDTEYGRIGLPLPAGACSAWLMSNHPTGDEIPNEADIRNARLLRHLLGRRRVRFFMTGEMIGCRETDLSVDD